jgi:hypothetical protein
MATATRILTLLLATFQIYMRGQARDYNEWAHTFGNKGWSWEEVLPLFMKVRIRCLSIWIGKGFHLIMCPFRAPLCLSRRMITAGRAKGMAPGGSGGWRSSAFGGTSSTPSETRVQRYEKNTPILINYILPYIARVNQKEEDAYSDIPLVHA